MYGGMCFCLAISFLISEMVYCEVVVMLRTCVVNVRCVSRVMPRSFTVFCLGIMVFCMDICGYAIKGVDLFLVKKVIVVFCAWMLR